ncbi:hypothetical protein EDF39_0762 [Frondihabitans sp. PhB161]|nr:hypothetical protein EDF39_0762 [Frondihabitans sp. PhB161]
MRRAAGGGRIHRDVAVGGLAGDGVAEGAWLNTEFGFAGGLRVLLGRTGGEKRPHSGGWGDALNRRRSLTRSRGGRPSLLRLDHSARWRGLLVNLRIRYANYEDESRREDEWDAADEGVPGS